MKVIFSQRALPCSRRGWSCNNFTTVILLQRKKYFGCLIKIDSRNCICASLSFFVILNNDFFQVSCKRKSHLTLHTMFWILLLTQWDLILYFLNYFMNISFPLPICHSTIFLCPSFKTNPSSLFYYLFMEGKYQVTQHGSAPGQSCAVERPDCQRLWVAVVVCVSVCVCMCVFVCVVKFYFCSNP